MSDKPKLDKTIREFVPADMASVLEIEATNAEPRWTEEEFKKYLADGYKIMVAERKGCMVGFAVYKEYAGKTVLKNIVVDPRCRSQGVGRQMVEALAAKLPTDTLEQVRCEIEETKHDLLRIFAKMGFDLTLREGDPKYDVVYDRKKHAFMQMLPLEQYTSMHATLEEVTGQKFKLCREVGTDDFMSLGKEQIRAMPSGEQQDNLCLYSEAYLPDAEAAMNAFNKLLKALHVPPSRYATIVQSSEGFGHLRIPLGNNLGNGAFMATYSFQRENMCGAFSNQSSQHRGGGSNRGWER